MAGSDRSLVVPRLGVCFLKPKTPSKCKWPTRAAAPMVQSTCMMLQPGDDSGNGNLVCRRFSRLTLAYSLHTANRSLILKQDRHLLLFRHDHEGIASRIDCYGATDHLHTVP
ncbi:hypothetical protein V2G26_017223 [Clonostachys chloroleuca]